MDGTSLYLRPLRTRIVGALLERPREILAPYEIAERINPEDLGRRGNEHSVVVELWNIRQDLDKARVNLEVLTVLMRGRKVSETGGYVLRKREGHGDAV